MLLRGEQAGAVPRRRRPVGECRGDQGHRALVQAAGRVAVRRRARSGRRAGRGCRGDPGRAAARRVRPRRRGRRGWSGRPGGRGRRRRAAPGWAVPPGKTSIDHPPPRIHSAPGLTRAYAATRARHSSVDVAACRSHWIISSPAVTGWTWASWKPGSSRPPPRSTTSVPDPAAARTSASVPTATIRPSRTATAPATEASCPALNSRALVRTVPRTESGASDTSLLPLVLMTPGADPEHTSCRRAMTARANSAIVAGNRTRGPVGTGETHEARTRTAHHPRRGRPRLGPGGRRHRGQRIRCWVATRRHHTTDGAARAVCPSARRGAGLHGLRRRRPGVPRLLAAGPRAHLADERSVGHLLPVGQLAELRVPRERGRPGARRRRRHLRGAAHGTPRGRPRPQRGQLGAGPRPVPGPGDRLRREHRDERHRPQRAGNPRGHRQRDRLPRGPGGSATSPGSRGAPRTRPRPRAPARASPSRDRARSRW